MPEQMRSLREVIRKIQTEILELMSTNKMKNAIESITITFNGIKLKTNGLKVKTNNKR